jgi:hypothetical protein
MGLGLVRQVIADHEEQLNRRGGFPHLPFYINANRNDKLKNMNAAEGIPTKQKSPVDPAESEVTQ